MSLANPVVESLAIGAIAGYFVGYMIKKLLHLALTIAIFAFLLMYLSYSNAITLNLEEIGANMQGYADVVLNRLGFATLVANTPFVGSLVVGLILGFRRS